MIVRHAHDGDILDGGVHPQKILDLTGIYILPPTNDHVLYPAYDAPIASVVQDGQIAAVHPAV